MEVCLGARMKPLSANSGNMQNEGRFMVCLACVIRPAQHLGVWFSTF